MATSQFFILFPIIADYERENPVFKEIVKIAITPMISSLSILNYVDMDSSDKPVNVNHQTWMIFIPMVAIWAYLRIEKLL